MTERLNEEERKLLQALVQGLQMTRSSKRARYMVVNEFVPPLLVAVEKALALATADVSSVQTTHALCELLAERDARIAELESRLVASWTDLALDGIRVEIPARFLAESHGYLNTAVRAMARRIEELEGNGS